MLRIRGCWLLLLLPCFSSAHNFTVRERTGCDDGKIRGVNLGGWLVMEPWITPKIFEAVNVGDLLDVIIDEWTYAEHVDKEVYMSNMIKHWDTFVTKQDFEILQAVGISHVRIPVAYWYWQVEEGEPFPQPNLDDQDPNSPLFYLRRALGWLDELGLKVNIDLHTGPGSQNGYDNSGRAGETHWVDDTYPENRHNIDRTVMLNGLISETMAGWISAGVLRQETLYGMGMLNEPHICGTWRDGGKWWPVCRDDYYPKAYAKFREYFGPEVWIIADEAGRSLDDFEGQYLEPDYVNLNIDAHLYQCFGGFWNGIAQAWDGWGYHIQESCSAQNFLGPAPLPTFVGEFSLSVTECTKYLTGYRTPYTPPSNPPEVCRYYNNDWSTYAEDYRQFLGNFFLAQIDGFEAGAGWFMWTMKTEDNAAPEWDFLFLVEKGIIPPDLCNRPRVCT